LTPSELALAGTVETTATMTATGPGLWAWLMQKALPNNPSCDATKRKGRLQIPTPTTRPAAFASWAYASTTNDTPNSACPRLQLQSIAPEDRRGLRQPRDHHRRQRAKLYASVRLDIRKTGVVKNGEQPVGNKTRVKVVKNKVAPPFRECEFEILYGVGVSATAEIVDLASEAGLIEKSGAYYSWNGERIAQGRDKACQYLAEHPELMDELRQKLVDQRKAENARMGAPAAVASSGESEAA
jgi:hypothetical protein